jgi:choice-of-anchor B domain-containing protein
MRSTSKLIFPVFSLLFYPLLSFCQLNMVLQDSMDYNVGVNDVCGWAAPDGKEYALVGLNTGVSIVDINEDTLHEVVFVPGVDNLWRDINIYDHYAYVSSEAQIGLLIIDLQYLPDSVKTWVWEAPLPTANGPKPFLKAHSLWTDPDGLLFLNGSNLNNGGVIICDIKTDPINPIFLGYGPAIYAHDCYSRDSIMYAAEIYAGNASIYDIHNPANVTLLGQVKTPYEFTHNIWLSDDSHTMFTTDERANSYVTSYDITNPGNIIELDRYRQAATDGLGNIVHNVYIWNDWAVVAYYANGTIILDASHPDNLVEVGNFDSFLGADGGFPGVWGSYPFLPSGKILSSDRNNGLFVFIPNYVRACYLEGSVVDSITHAPLYNAVVKIESTEVIYPQNTKPDGTFKMGKAVPGHYPVKVTKEGYFDKIVDFDFVNGQLLNPIIEMRAIPAYSLIGKVVHDDQSAIPFAKVIVQGNNLEYETTCDANGDFAFPSIFEGNYEIEAGIWDFIYEAQVDMHQPVNMTLETAKGYKDDFDLDLGWTVSGDAINGGWVRDQPETELLYNQFLCGSNGDSKNDNGPYAYTTGISSPSGDVFDSEVNGGVTWLASPPMDFSTLVDPKITFDYWLCEFPPNQYDGVYVWLTNGVDTFQLDELRNDTIVGSWQTKTYDHILLHAPIDHYQLLVSAMDTTTGSNFFVVKMHFDNFKVEEGASGTQDELASSASFLFYPNPLSGSRLYLKSQTELEGNVMSIQITDPQGRIVQHQTINKSDFEKGMDVRLPEGMYFIQWHTEKNESGVQKLIILNP